MLISKTALLTLLTHSDTLFMALLVVVVVVVEVGGAFSCLCLSKDDRGQEFLTVFTRKSIGLGKKHNTVNKIKLFNNTSPAKEIKCNLAFKVSNFAILWL